MALKKLDAKAKRPANIFAYSFGILASLVIGFGMCLSMAIIGSGTAASMIAGIIMGIIGLIAMGLNYPIKGIMAIINEWLADDCKDNIEKIIFIIQSCIAKNKRKA